MMFTITCCGLENGLTGLKEEVRSPVWSSPRADGDLPRADVIETDVERSG